MLWKTVPDPYKRRLEKLDRRRLRVEYGNRQFMRRSGMQTPSKLRLCWMMKFVSEVSRCQAKDICKPERPACNLSAVELPASVIGVRSGVM